MNEPRQPNSWSRMAPQGRPDSRMPGEVGRQPDWRLMPLPVGGGDGLFETAARNPVLRVLTAFAKRRVPALACGLLLIAGSVYCLAAPSGTGLAGLPVEFCSIGLAAAAMLLALLVTLGAWLRPLESVEDAMEVLGVPLVAFEKGGPPDVR